MKENITPFIRQAYMVLSSENRNYMDEYYTQEF